MNYEAHVRTSCLKCRGEGNIKDPGRPGNTTKCMDCDGTGWQESWKSFRDLERDLQRSESDRQARR